MRHQTSMDKERVEFETDLDAYYVSNNEKDSRDSNYFIHKEGCSKSHHGEIEESPDDKKESTNATSDRYSNQSSTWTTMNRSLNHKAMCAACCLITTAIVTVVGVALYFLLV